MTVAPNHNRLDGHLFTFHVPVSVDQAGMPTEERMELSVWIHRTPDGKPLEIVPVAPPTKPGQALFVTFREFGIQLSRALQWRDPVTGEALPEAER